MRLTFRLLVIVYSSDEFSWEIASFSCLCLYFLMCWHLYVKACQTCACKVKWKQAMRKKRKKEGGGWVGNAVRRESGLGSITVLLICIIKYVKFLHFAYKRGSEHELMPMWHASIAGVCFHNYLRFPLFFLTTVKQTFPKNHLPSSKTNKSVSDDIISGYYAQDFFITGAVTFWCDI